MTSPYGTIETLDDGRYVLRYERRLRHPIEFDIDFLEDALDSRPVDWPSWPQDRWQVHFERYEASMRPIS